MTRMPRRVALIFTKWAALAFAIFILWALGVFHALFVLLLFVIQEVNKGLVWLGEPTQEGWDAYWAEMWVFWLLFYAVFFILFAIYYYAYWKHKRPDLMVGGVRDGRVLWIKGVRRGLLYDFWDAYNYLKGAGNPFARASRMRGSKRNTEGAPGMLQDPLRIPIGRETRRRVVYFSRPWSLRIDRLILQDTTKMVIHHSKVSIPAGYIINLEDPLTPGKRILVWTTQRPLFEEHEPQQQQTALEDTLVVAKGNVRGSVAANPSIITNEYQDGSIGKV